MIEKWTKFMSMQIIVVEMYGVILYKRILTILIVKEVSIESHK